ncbi:hypothetical protein NC652_011198 [Populus alba x Populus x berolinensis]|uniref:Uncharacterized protein n=1 Tax=Populus alba x Populus x berolinensis TaxID=444605 RepID=A0AAD6W646_9ROSI|nr:hypothetical protein NC652_011198 [Populus alba x Populus x berolinensis]KAJ7000743.1 hypothetical protein NC653_011255 [Populus alba x Populus x berolinensis]
MFCDASWMEPSSGEFSGKRSCSWYFRSRRDWEVMGGDQRGEEIRNAKDKRWKGLVLEAVTEGGRSFT